MVQKFSWLIFLNKWYTSYSYRTQVLPWPECIVDKIETALLSIHWRHNMFLTRTYLMLPVNAKKCVCNKCTEINIISLWNLKLISITLVSHAFIQVYLVSYLSVPVSMEYSLILLGSLAVSQTLYHMQGSLCCREPPPM